MSDNKTKDFLRDFGVGDTYRGFRYCIYSVRLAVEAPERLNSVTKNIYQDVAKRYRTSAGCVERDIRTVAEVVWRNGGKDFFYSTTGELFGKRPANSKFLEMLAHYFTSEESVAGHCRDCVIIANCKGRIIRLEEDIRQQGEEIKKLKEVIIEMNRKRENKEMG